MIRHLELSEIDWIGIKDYLPIGENEEDEEKRKIMF